MPSPLETPIPGLTCRQIPSRIRCEEWEELPTGLGLKTTWNLLWTWSKPHIRYSSLLAWQKVSRKRALGLGTCRRIQVRRRCHRIHSQGVHAFCHLSSSSFWFPCAMPEAIGCDIVSHSYKNMSWKTRHLEPPCTFPCVGSRIIISRFLASRFSPREHRALF